ncbi:shikimate kinase [Pseudacidovorax intermedius]|uniref:Shikimate kinase n=2 Tax=Pseudacidovorax intermedius TaxID=433924 RepID=A0A147HBL0_9BURK|nr:shikimate kinase [Pseudacidovorax intermedius]
MPGAGKSAVGKELGRRLHLGFTDSDVLIEQRIGCSIREYFEREGEAAFRDLEEQVLAELGRSAGGVVATGGGIVIRPANRDCLKGAFRVIYLHASAEDLYRRLRHDTKRPLLQVSDPLGRLRELYAARDALYREVAHAVVETGRASVGAVVAGVQQALESAPPAEGAATPL